MDLEGNSYDDSDLDGNVAVIYLLGSGCSICVGLAERIESDFVTKYSGQNVAVYAIDSLDGHYEELERLRDSAGVRYPFLLNGSEFASACGVKWHTFLVVDSRGYIRYVSEGANTAAYDPSAMQAVVDEFLDDGAEEELVTWGEIKRIWDDR